MCKIGSTVFGQLCQCQDASTAGMTGCCDNWDFWDLSICPLDDCAPDLYALRIGEHLTFIPGAGEAIAKLNRAGYPVIVITNQSAIVRGSLAEEGLAEILVALKDQLSAFDATIDAIYHCPIIPTAARTPSAIAASQNPA